MLLAGLWRVEWRLSLSHSLIRLTESEAKNNVETLESHYVYQMATRIYVSNHR